MEQDTRGQTDTTRLQKFVSFRNQAKKRKDTNKL